MTLIALIHLFWLFLLPVGAIVLLKSAISPQRRGVGAALGVALLVGACPAVFFCRSMWPLDFLGFGQEVRVPVNGRGYTVAMVQKPGSDFYDSFLEICRPDGKRTRLMVDWDADKWWGLHARTDGTRTAFVTGAGDVVGSVDFADGALSGSIDGFMYTLDGLNFDRAWSNAPF
jgi:hypothetical protein